LGQIIIGSPSCPIIGSPHPFGHQRTFSNRYNLLSSHTTKLTTTIISGYLVLGQELLRQTLLILLQHRLVGQVPNIFKLEHALAARLNTGQTVHHLLLDLALQVRLITRDASVVFAPHHEDLMHLELLLQANGTFKESLLRRTLCNIEDQRVPLGDRK